MLVFPYLVELQAILPRGHNYLLTSSTFPVASDGHLSIKLKGDRILTNIQLALNTSIARALTNFPLIPTGFNYVLSLLVMSFKEVENHFISKNE